MTQGRHGISLAPARTRRNSLMVAMFAMAAMLAGTAGTSFAKPHHKGPDLFDSVVVSNYGSAFAGSLETFIAGGGANASPFLWVKGTNTLLGSGTGPEGVSVSSLDAHVAVAIPIDLLDLTGFGAAAGLSTHAGTGFAEIFSPGATANSVPENIIGTPNVSFGAFNNTAIDTPQAVAFEDPFDGVNPGRDILAVGNTLPLVVGPDNIPESACAAFGGATVGTITEYDRTTLTPGINNIKPFNNSPITALDDTTGEPIYAHSTIGGCLTFLLGPVGLAWDETGFLFAVNEAAVAQGGPGFVTVYQPGASGDSFPFAIVGLLGPTAGAFVDPARIAVGHADIDGSTADTDFFDDIIFVSDVGDNSVKIFAPFVNFDLNTFFYEGQQLGTIKGGATKFFRPEGVAYSMDSGALYVVNNNKNSLEMFADIGLTGGNIAPTLIVSGKKAKMNFPVDVALPAFTPSSRPTETIVGELKH